MKRSLILIVALTLILGFATTSYANIYATNVEVSATVITTGATNSTVDISFILNEDADSGVEVNIYSGASLVRTITLATATMGANSVTWDGTDAGGTTLSDGDYTFEVMAADDGYAEWTRISDPLKTVMYSPKGVAVNRNLDSEYFGRVYISNGYAGTSGNTGAFYNGKGVTMYDAVQDTVAFSTGGIAWASSSDSPGKSSIGLDDKIYVTEYGSDLLYGFNGDMTGALNVLEADNRLADQYISANWVDGTGADRAIYTADMHYATGRGIVKYELGLNDEMPAGDTGIDIIERPNGAYYQSDVELDSQGNIYFTQYRGAADQAYALMKYPPYTGTTLTIDDTLWTIPLSMFAARGLAIDEATNRVAWASEYTGDVIVHDLTTGAIVDTVVTGQGRNKDVAFDAAGNLYTIDNNTEYWNVWSTPDGANSFTTPGRATIAIETPPAISTVFISELADPNNNAGLRFVEIHNAADLALDLTGWELRKYTNASATVSQTLSLTGSIPALGNFVIAAGAADADFEAGYGMAPDMFDGADNNVAGSNGDDNLELVDAAGIVVDQFGIPGEDGSGTNHEFEDGRAVRLESVTVGNPTWDPTEWSIDSDQPSGAGPQDAPDDFDPYVWPTIIPQELVSAVSISATEIEVVYSLDLTTVDIADYFMLGTAGVTFTSATIDAADAKLVHLVASADIVGDAITDTLMDDGVMASYEFLAGITPIEFTNTLNPAGTIAEGIPGTFVGLVTGNNDDNNVWINDGNEAYMGVLIFDWSFDGLVAVGEEIMIVAELATYNNLSELKNPVLLGVQSTGNPTIPAVITGAAIDSSIAADTNPAEQWEGQLVQIMGATVLTWDVTNSIYELTDDDGVSEFVVGDNIATLALTVGTEYDITGVVDYSGDIYRLNPRDQTDAEEVILETDLNLTFEDDTDAANWGVYDGATGFTAVTFDAAAGVDGSGAMVFGDGGYAYYIKRPINATVGTDYMLSLDLKTLGWATPDTYPITLSVEGLEAEENSVSINSLAEFTNIVLMGTAVNPSGYIKLEGSNTSAASAGGTINVTIDNLVFDDDYMLADLDLDLTFEDATDAANWAVYDGASGFTTVAHDATAGVDASGALVFGDGGYGFYIKRPVAATVGEEYSFTIDVKTLGWDAPDTYPVTLAIEGLGAEENSVSINALADFTTMTLTGTATNAAGYIKIAGSNTSAASAGGTISVTIDNLMFDDNLGIIDVDAPALLSAAALSSSIVELVFNEDIDPVTGAVLANYTLDHGLGAPTAAIVLEDMVTLTLGTGMMFDSTYTVITNNVADVSGNVLLADTASFMYSYEFVTDLFFSEYVEGSSSNKVLEIYNPTDAAIDLSGYTIGGTSNAATDWEYFYTFPDTALSIGAMSTYLIVDSGAEQELLDMANWVTAYPGPTSYNGNDARGLMKVVGLDTILIDALGDYNNPDELMYTVAGVADGMKDHTLVRKAAMTMGNPDWMMSSGLDAETSEWVMFPQNTYRFLGAHPHADLAGPELVGVVAVSETQIQLRFSEAVVSADALTLANYSVSDDLGTEAPTVITMLTDAIYLLDVPALVPNQFYSVAVTGVHDLLGNEIMPGSALDVMLDIPGSLPIDRIMNDFVTDVGNWGHPTYSGSTSGVLATSTFESSDSMAFAGTHSGEMILLDDPGVDGGWFVRLWNINRVDRIAADSKMFFYLYGGSVDMQARIVVKDDDGYEAGPWQDLTFEETDWQVVSVDLENDVMTGWITGNSTINAAGGSVAIDGLQLRCSEDVSTNLYFDMVTERFNIEPVEVTFDVQMSVQTLMETFIPGTDFLDIAGSINDWGNHPMVLDDPEADSLYTITVTDVYPGETLEYKFRINGNWDTSEFPGGGANRTYVVPDTNSVVFHWYDDVDTYVGVAGLAIPTEYALHNNYPNPFNPVTNIKYDLPEQTQVRISVYNTIGQHVIDLVNEDQSAGFYQLQWNGLSKQGKPVSSGLYIYRLTTPEFTKSAKMTYLK